MFNLFRRKPSISSVGRALALHRAGQDRARVKAVARQIRAELNLPASEALRG